MPPVALQLGFAGAAGADAAALPGQALAHAGEPWQEILILGQLHLEAALLGLGPLGEDVHNEGAAVQHRQADDLLQGPDISRGKLVVEDDHGRRRGLRQHADLLGLALADEAVGVWIGPVLQHLAGAEAACGFQQGLQLFQALLCGGLLLGKAGGVQPNQHRPLLLAFKIFFHMFLR